MTKHLFSLLLLSLSALFPCHAAPASLWQPVWATASLRAPEVLTLRRVQGGVCLPCDANGTVWLGGQNGVPNWPFRDVEGGTFTMGNLPNDSQADSDETRHQVGVSGYLIGTFEVTQEQWEWVMGSNPSYWKGANLPVETVSWNDCQEFVSRLNAKRTQIAPELAQARFRLPTEAEWEFAARGGTRSNGYLYSGSNNIEDVAWYNGNSGSRTHPVGMKRANELGIHDMTGNVWEWCQDWYGSYPTAFQNNPQGPTSGSNRVNRGGSWGYFPQGCRASNRDFNAPDDRYDYLGLLLVLQFP